MSQHVRTEIVGCVGVITLARPKALNALDGEMARAGLAALEAWRDDARVSAVWLQGEGPKAFCAGGDVRVLARLLLEDRAAGEAACRAYFEDEYRWDHALHTFPKPVVTWGHGHVLGGGLGMFLAGDVRVVTEDARLAMPEVRIGLFPDVGASAVLSRVGPVGTWMALTGARVAAADALALDLADLHLPGSRRAAALEALAGARIRGVADVAAVLGSWARRAGGPRPARRRAERLATLLEGSDATALARVRKAATDPDPWVASSASTLADGAPLSARVVLEQLRRARQLPLADVFRQDLVLATNLVALPDFAEGVRAHLIDKDGAPRWSPAGPDDVDEALVQAQFRSPFGDAHPLDDLV